VCGGVCGVYEVKFVIAFAVPPTPDPTIPTLTPTPSPTKIPTATWTPTSTPTPTATQAGVLPVESPPPPQPGKVEEMFKVANVHHVESGATVPTTFTVDSTWLVTQLRTYHWNEGQGTTPGTIGLVSIDGAIYGPWQAYGQPGMGGLENAYWAVEPNVAIGPGTYMVVDSDPDTWSQNKDTGGRGMAWGYGIRQN
jgi:hypothetical protein